MPVIAELLILDADMMKLRHPEVARRDTQMWDQHVAPLVHLARSESELAPRGQRDDHLARQHRHERPVSAGEIEGEGLVNSHHLIEPRLQGRRHAVVVHRRREDDDIGGRNLGDQVVGDTGELLLLRGHLGAEDSRDPCFGDDGRRRHSNISDHNLDVGFARGPFIDELVAQRARQGSRGTGAGVDSEDACHFIGPSFWCYMWLYDCSDGRPACDGFPEGNKALGMLNGVVDTPTRRSGGADQ